MSFPGFPFPCELQCGCDLVTHAKNLPKKKQSIVSSYGISTSLMVISPLLSGPILRKWSQEERRCNIKSRAHSTFGYIVFLVGMLLTVGGLCILLINLLHH